jgi:DNA repair protein RadC
VEQKIFSDNASSEKTTSLAKTHAKGKSALSDAELIAILIGLGSRNESAVELSKRILKSKQ